MDNTPFSRPRQTYLVVQKPGIQSKSHQSFIEKNCDILIKQKIFTPLNLMYFYCVNFVLKLVQSMSSNVLQKYQQTKFSMYTIYNNVYHYQTFNSTCDQSLLQKKQQIFIVNIGKGYYNQYFSSVAKKTAILTLKLLTKKLSECNTIKHLFPDVTNIFFYIFSSIFLF